MRAGATQNEQAAEDRARQHGEERPHFHHAIAAEQFCLGQILRQHRIFDRAEKRRLRTRQENAQKLQPDMAH